MGELVIREWKGQAIRQRVDGFLDGTAMCKSEGKLVGDYLRLTRTKSFLKELSANMGIPILELVQSEVGGDHAGTWLHRRVAIHLAQWCSSAFEVAVSGWIEELLTRGQVQLHPTPAPLTLEAVREMATAIGREIARELVAVPRQQQEMITVEQRCRDRWPAATSKNRKRIREILTGLMMLRGSLPSKQGTAANSTLVVERDDLGILDDAIDRARDEIRERNRNELFGG